MFHLFSVWVRARALPKQQKKHGPAQTVKKMNNAPPKRSVYFFFCCLGGWACLFSFAVWAEACCFFAVWAGSCFLFLLLSGRGACFCFAVWAGGGGGACCFVLLFGRGTEVHSLTPLPGSSLSDPTTKKTKQHKKTRFLTFASAFLG